ncbi:MAG: PrsW family glutamic-type intramembrane protease [Candidatus Zixiibacteriota bacterium]
MIDLLHIAVSLAPVFVFLILLIALDSYKLVTLSLMARTILIGCLVALACLYVNSWLMQLSGLKHAHYTRYMAPLVEESLKALFIVYLMRVRRVGFMVDAAICGFAIGAGFALIENIYYLQTVADSNIFLWVIRGFGTAIMHGGTTAIFAVLSTLFLERRSRKSWLALAPGLASAVVIHSMFNHFILPPVYTTGLLLIIQPALLVIVFHYSERSLENWLGVGLDAEMELFDLITSGNISGSRIGRYLDSLKERFRGEVVVDILCFLRLRLELAMTAKGILIMRQGGHDVRPDEETAARLEELTFLEGAIGATGKLAIAPFLRSSDRDLWQLQMLNAKS